MSGWHWTDEERALAGSKDLTNGMVAVLTGRSDKAVADMRKRMARKERETTMAETDTGVFGQGTDMSAPVYQDEVMPENLFATGAWKVTVALRGGAIVTLHSTTEPSGEWFNSRNPTNGIIRTVNKLDLTSPQDHGWSGDLAEIAFITWEPA